MIPLFATISRESLCAFLLSDSRPWVAAAGREPHGENVEASLFDRCLKPTRCDYLTRKSAGERYGGRRARKERSGNSKVSVLAEGAEIGGMPWASGARRYNDVQLQIHMDGCHP